MLKVVNDNQQDILETADEMDLLENVKYQKRFRNLLIMACVWIIFSKYTTLYTTGLFLMSEMFGLYSIVKNPTYRLDCSVVCRKTGCRKGKLFPKYFINVRTADGAIWTARVSRRAYVKAKRGAEGSIYFTDKDVDKNRAVVFELD